MGRLIEDSSLNNDALYISPVVAVQNISAIPYSSLRRLAELCGSFNFIPSRFAIRNGDGNVSLHLSLSVFLFIFARMRGICEALFEERFQTSSVHLFVAGTGCYVDRSIKMASIVIVSLSIFFFFNYGQLRDVRISGRRDRMAP